MNPEVRLFVGNLPEDTREYNLQDAFSKFGKVINIDLKQKIGSDALKKNFAFITLSAKDREVESCLKYFSSYEFCGSKIYVSRARESFLEKLQKERQEANLKNELKTTPMVMRPVINLGEKLNPRQRRIDYELNNVRQKTNRNRHYGTEIPSPSEIRVVVSEQTHKKQESDKKRLESLRRKRQEFKEKQNVIRSGFIHIDKMPNKKIRFSNLEDEPHEKPEENINTENNKIDLFEDDYESFDEFNFEYRKQFEGKHGKQVLDLQSRYQSDKRFTLDERFIDDVHQEEGKEDSDPAINIECESVDIGQSEEKVKQLSILQDVLGVCIKTSVDPTNKKPKLKQGMLRFDPSHPEHTKFLANVEQTPDPQKKSKKKKTKQMQEIEAEPELKPQEAPKVEVSKEQFYKVSETLKEVIAQPTTFSLRSLFSKNENDKDNNDETNFEEQQFIPINTKKVEKRKNPLDPGERNPFVFDSSDSDDEKMETENNDLPKPKVKAVWRENLFFTDSDNRLKEGLRFFNMNTGNEGQKERRELKSLMKKRIYNKERKNQMFKKKIGGKRKSMKKSFRRKS